MVKIIFSCLFLALGVWGCDDGCRIGALCDDSSDLGGCPVEDLMRPRKCNLFCEAEGMDRLSVDPSTCEFLDCFTMDCENDIFEVADFPMVMISFDGGDTIDYRCGFIVVDGCV